MKVVAEVSVDLDEKRAVRVEAFVVLESASDLPGAADNLCEATRKAALAAYHDAVQRRLAIAPGQPAPKPDPDLAAFGDD
jgi:hypothetical protein